MTKMNRTARKSHNGSGKTRRQPRPSMSRRKSKRDVSRSQSAHENANTVRIFLEMLNMVKLYHWKTRSYAQHKATDHLYENLNENIDKLVEVLLGKDETRIKMTDKKMDLIDCSNTHDFKERIYKYREFLLDMNERFDPVRDSDLLSIRDDILVDIDQFLYLMTFDK
jgi:DNA-binding ferritin-like protein